MKKFLFISLFAILSCMAFQVQAQVSIVMPLAAGDTTVNTGTASKVIHITDGYAGIALTVVLTKISGTNGGTVGIYGSPDGTNYDLIGSTYSVTTASSQSKTFYISAPLPEYIKTLETGTGTMSTVLTVKYRLPKYKIQQ